MKQYSKESTEVMVNQSQGKTKILIKETLYNSVAQALIKLIETKYFSLKLLLSIFVLVSVCFCSSLIRQLILSYLSFEVSTTTRTLYETPALFPKVTICNVNPFTTEYALEFLKEISHNFKSKIDIFNKTKLNRLNQTYKSSLISNVYHQAIFKMNSLNQTEKRKLSHPIEDMLQNCYFNAQPCSEFNWYFDPYYGNCWVFNSEFNPLGFNSFPGEFYGLSLVLYVNFHESLKTINSYNGGLGAVIRIDNSSYLTSYIGSDGIKVEPGHKTSISVSRSFKYSLPRPYSNCQIDNKTKSELQSELFNIILNSAYRYTQPTCFQQCLQRAIYLECNCTDPSYVSLFTNVTQCLSLKETQCMIHLYDEKLYKDDFIQTNCISDCPLECYIEKFDVSLSSFELGSKYFFDYLKTNTKLNGDFLQTKLDLEMARKSFVGLNIFYKSLSYEISTESPQTDLIWLLASIGGYLGLFLGVSVFSLFEPFVVLIEIFFIKFY